MALVVVLLWLAAWLTLGAPGGAADAVARMGATHEARDVTQACLDEAQRVATSPAYMDDGANPWQVYEGIGRMIEAVVKMAGKTPVLA